eukprot:gene638-1071_t
MVLKDSMLNKHQAYATNKWRDNSPVVPSQIVPETSPLAIPFDGKELCSGMLRSFQREYAQRLNLKFACQKTRREQLRQLREGSSSAIDLPVEGAVSSVLWDGFPRYTSSYYFQAVAQISSLGLHFPETLALVLLSCLPPPKAIKGVRAIMDPASGFQWYAAQNPGNADKERFLALIANLPGNLISLVAPIAQHCSGVVSSPPIPRSRPHDAPPPHVIASYKLTLNERDDAEDLGYSALLVGETEAEVVQPMLERWTKELQQSGRTPTPQDSADLANLWRLQLCSPRLSRRPSDKAGGDLVVLGEHLGVEAMVPGRACRCVGPRTVTVAVCEELVLLLPLLDPVAAAGQLEERKGFMGSLLLHPEPALNYAISASIQAMAAEQAAHRAALLSALLEMLHVTGVRQPHSLFKLLTHAALVLEAWERHLQAALTPGGGGIGHLEGPQDVDVLASAEATALVYSTHKLQDPSMLAGPSSTMGVTRTEAVRVIAVQLWKREGERVLAGAHQCLARKFPATASELASLAAKAHYDARTPLVGIASAPALDRAGVHLQRVEGGGGEPLGDLGGAGEMAAQAWAACLVQIGQLVGEGAFHCAYLKAVATHLRQLARAVLYQGHKEFRDMDWMWISLHGLFFSSCTTHAVLPDASPKPPVHLWPVDTTVDMAFGGWREELAPLEDIPASWQFHAAAGETGAVEMAELAAEAAMRTQAEAPLLEGYENPRVEALGTLEDVAAIQNLLQEYCANGSWLRSLRAFTSEAARTGMMWTTSLLHWSTKGSSDLNLKLAPGRAPEALARLDGAGWDDVKAVADLDRASPGLAAVFVKHLVSQISDRRAPERRDPVHGELEKMADSPAASLLGGSLLGSGQSSGGKAWWEDLTLEARVFLNVALQDDFPVAMSRASAAAAAEKMLPEACLNFLERAQDAIMDALVESAQPAAAAGSFLPPKDPSDALQADPKLVSKYSRLLERLAEVFTRDPRSSWWPESERNRTRESCIRMYDLVNQHFSKLEAAAGTREHDDDPIAAADVRPQMKAKQLAPTPEEKPTEKYADAQRDAALWQQARHALGSAVEELVGVPGEAAALWKQLRGPPSGLPRPLPELLTAVMPLEQGGFHVAWAVLREAENVSPGHSMRECATRACHVPEREPHADLYFRILCDLVRGSRPAQPPAAADTAPATEGAAPRPRGGTPGPSAQHCTGVAVRVGPLVLGAACLKLTSSAPGVRAAALELLCLMSNHMYRLAPGGSRPPGEGAGSPEESILESHRGLLLAKLLASKEVHAKGVLMHVVELCGGLCGGAVVSETARLARLAFPQDHTRLRWLLEGDGEGGAALASRGGSEVFLEMLYNLTMHVSRTLSASRDALYIPQEAMEMWTKLAGAAGGPPAAQRAQIVSYILRRSISVALDMPLCTSVVLHVYRQAPAHVVGMLVDAEPPPGEAGGSPEAGLLLHQIAAMSLSEEGNAAAAAAGRGAVGRWGLNELMRGAGGKPAAHGKDGEMGTAQTLAMALLAEVLCEGHAEIATELPRVVVHALLHAGGRSGVGGSLAGQVLAAVLACTPLIPLSTSGVPGAEGKQGELMLLRRQRQLAQEEVCVLAQHLKAGSLAMAWDTAGNVPATAAEGSHLPGARLEEYPLKHAVQLILHQLAPCVPQLRQLVGEESMRWALHGQQAQCVDRALQLYALVPATEHERTLQDLLQMLLAAFSQQQHLEVGIVQNGAQEQDRAGRHAFRIAQVLADIGGQWVDAASEECHPALFWIALALLRCRHVRFYDAGLRLLESVLGNPRARDSLMAAAAVNMPRPAVPGAEPGDAARSLGSSGPPPLPSARSRLPPQRAARSSPPKRPSARADTEEPRGASPRPPTVGPMDFWAYCQSWEGPFVGVCAEVMWGLGHSALQARALRLLTLSAPQHLVFLLEPEAPSFLPPLLTAALPLPHLYCALRGGGTVMGSHLVTSPSGGVVAEGGFGGELGGGQGGPHASALDLCSSVVDAMRQFASRSLAQSTRKGDEEVRAQRWRALADVFASYIQGIYDAHPDSFLQAATHALIVTLSGSDERAAYAHILAYQFSAFPLDPPWRAATIRIALALLSYAGTDADCARILGPVVDAAVEEQHRSSPPLSAELLQTAVIVRRLGLQAPPQLSPAAADAPSQPPAADLNAGPGSIICKQLLERTSHQAQQVDDSTVAPAMSAIRQVAVAQSDRMLHLAIHAPHDPPLPTPRAQSLSMAGMFDSPPPPSSPPFSPRSSNTALQTLATSPPDSEEEEEEEELGNEEHDEDGEEGDLNGDSDVEDEGEGADFSEDNADEDDDGSDLDDGARQYPQRQWHVAGQRPRTHTSAF